MLQCRPEDMQYSGRVCYPNPCFHEPSTKHGQLGVGQTPLDVIVSTGSTARLIALMTHMCQRNPQKLSPGSWLCIMNQPKALAMLIKTPSITHEELKVCKFCHCHFSPQTTVVSITYIQADMFITLYLCLWVRTHQAEYWWVTFFFRNYSEIEFQFSSLEHSLNLDSFQNHQLV